MNDTLEYNKQTVGKRVLVLEPKRTFSWEGLVVGIKDEETFIVSDGARDFEISMYYLRNIENEPGT